MAKKIGIVSINLVAGTADFNARMEQAKAKISAFGAASQAASHTAVSGMQATSATVRVLQGGLTNNLRAVERFAASTLKLGPILQAAFPLIGGLAFAGLIVSMGEKVYEFFKKASEGPARIANAFRELNAPLKLTNDELRVANDRLTNDIAKLEGKRQNTLALALDEARVAADKLAESLLKDLSGLNKLLKEENINALRGFFTDQAPTTKIREYFGGKTGTGGYYGDVAQATDEGKEKINAAADRGDKKGQDAAVIELYTTLENKRAVAIAQTNDKLREFQRLQDAHNRRNPFVGAVTPATDDQSANIEFAQGALRQLKEEGDAAKLARKNAALTQRKDADTAANTNEGLGRPLQDKLKALDAQLTEAASRLSGAGKSAATQELMKANAAAVKSIEEVNKALEHQHTKLDAAGKAAIHLRETGIALVTAEADWKVKLATTTSEMEDRIASQQMLTAAIGAGYEATKKANVETQVMAKVGHEHYNDPAWMKGHSADVTQIRTGAAGEYEAKHGEQVATAIDLLEDQIKLEVKLASVQVQGAEAVRQATLALRLEKMREAGATEKQIQAEKDLYAATRTDAVAKQITGLKLQIDATDRLTAARIHGAEVVRQVEIQLEQEKIDRETTASDTTPEQLAAIAKLKGLTAQEAEKKHQAEITAEVLKTANADRNRLADLNLEEAAALKLKAEGADQLGIEIKLRDIENERLRIQADQLLQFGGIRDGVKAFFLEMEMSAKTAASIIEEALNSAFNQVSENLAKLVTGGKADFAAMLKDIGRQMVQSSIKSAMQQGLGALAKQFPGLAGILPKTKRDGQSSDGALFVQLAKAGGETGIGGSSGETSGGGPSGIFGKALKLFGLGGAATKRDGQTEGSAYFVQVAKSGGSGGGAAGGGLSGILGSLFGGGADAGAGAAAGAGDGLTEAISSSISFMAGGGDMSADKAYVVGEKGPELLHKTAGTVTSNSQSRKLMSKSGGDHYYTIDARGTDPVLTEQRTRAAIIAAHSDSISKGMQVQQEHLKRTPQR